MSSRRGSSYVRPLWEASLALWASKVSYLVHLANSYSSLKTQLTHHLPCEEGFPRKCHASTVILLSVYLCMWHRQMELRSWAGARQADKRQTSICLSAFPPAPQVLESISYLSPISRIQCLAQSRWSINTCRLALGTFGLSMMLNVELNINRGDVLSCVHFFNKGKGNLGHDIKCFLLLFRPSGHCRWLGTGRGRNPFFCRWRN